MRTEGRRYLKTLVLNTGVAQPQDKKYWPQQRVRQGTGCLLQLEEAVRLCQHLSFSPVILVSDFWPPELQGSISIVLNQQVCGNLLQQLQEHNTANTGSPSHYSATKQWFILGKFLFPYVPPSELHHILFSHPSRQDFPHSQHVSTHIPKVKNQRSGKRKQEKQLTTKDKNATKAQDFVQPKVNNAQYCLQSVPGLVILCFPLYHNILNYL